MTTATNDTVERYDVNGTGPYAYSFRIFDESELTVRVIQDSTGNATPLTLDTHYTVAGVDDEDGGTVTLTSGTATTYASGYTLDIRSDTAQEQGTAFGPYSPRVVERAIDALSRQIQDLQRKVSASVRMPDYEIVDPVLDSPVNRRNKYWGHFTDTVAATPELFTSIGAQALSQSIIAALLNPQTSVETDVGATVVNSHFVVGCVDRYGTNTTPGTTSMAVAFQRAINVAKSTGIEVTYGATWPYLIDAALDLSVPVGISTQKGFLIRNTAQVHANTLNSPTYPSIILKHTGIGFDMTGSLGIHWIDVTVGTDNTTFPSICWLLARNSDGSSRTDRFDRCRTIGKFSTCVLYNYGAEDDQYNGCQFYNTLEATADTKSVIITANNSRGVASTFTTIATGARSTIDHKFFGGEYMMFSANASADCFELEQAQSVKIIGPWVKCGTQAAGGRSLFFVNNTNGPTNFLYLDKVTGEQGVEPLYGVRVANGAAFTSSSWSIRDCVLPNATFMFSADANASFSELNITNVWEQANHGISIPATVSGGFIDLTTFVVIGTLKWAVLSGFSESWTITTMTDCNLIDRTVTSTWTPGTGALTITGALTTANNRFAYDGKYMDVQVNLNAATSIVCAAGVAITGLPRASKDSSGIVTVVNQNTPAAIGTGYVNGTSMILPAINITTEVLIFRARYRIS